MEERYVFLTLKLLLSEDVFFLLRRGGIGLLKVEIRSIRFSF